MEMKLVHGLNRGDSLETYQQCKNYNEFIELAKIVNKNGLIFTGKYTLASESEEAIENFANKHNFLKQIVYFSLGIYYFMEENDDLEQISHSLFTLFISTSSQLKLNCDDEEKLYSFIHDASEIQNQLWFNLSQRRIKNRKEMN